MTVVPKHLADRCCKITINTNGRTDHASWYEMWEAVQAMYGMCLRFGKAGRAINRGLSLTSS